MNAPLIARNRDFLLLWTSQVLSQSGNRMYQIAISWWILSNVVKNSGTTLALFMVLASLPAIFLVKWIGRVVDRYTSKKVLISSDLMGASFSLLLIASFSGEVYLELILFSGLVFALCQGFIEPTLNKAVPELVEEDDISGAVAFLSSTQTLANFAGAILGALLIDKIGLVGVTVLNGASYFFSAICDGLIRFRDATSSGALGEDERLSGWKILDDKPLLRNILITFGLVNFFGTPILVVLPIYTKFALQASATTLGALEACIWLGILAGTFASPLLPLRQHTLRFTTYCLVSFAVCLALPSVIVDKIFYAAALFGAGFSLGAMNVRMISLFQDVIFNSQKGRFFALLQALVSFAIPVGYFGFAALSDYFSVRYLCLIQGVGVSFLALFFLRYSRYQGKLDDYRQQKLSMEGA